ncbi:MAG: hypothetical protein HYX94_03035 [Chloroflexi bacterium]|nr:hypothetical protein [Chloroflexota bacterium]
MAILHLKVANLIDRRRDTQPFGRAPRRPAVPQLMKFDKYGVRRQRIGSE